MADTIDDKAKMALPEGRAIAGPAEDRRLYDMSNESSIIEELGRLRFAIDTFAGEPALCAALRAEFATALKGAQAAGISLRGVPAAAEAARAAAQRDEALNATDPEPFPFYIVARHA